MDKQAKNVFPTDATSDARKEEKNRGTTNKSKLKLIVAGASVTLLVISAVAVALSAFSQSRELTLCEKIKQAKHQGQDQIEGDFNWLDVNLCRESTCRFDTDSCEVECPFGYELDANDCPISCDCVPDTRGTFQGDLQIDEDEMELFLTQYGYMDQDAEFAIFADSSVESGQKLMMQPEYVDNVPMLVMPYHIESDIDAKTKDTIRRVLKEVDDMIPCVKIIDLREGLVDANWLRMQFVKKSGCWSGIGRKGDINRISLDVGCGDESTIKHMIYHRLGFHHEHSRSDRDDTVTINYDNMKRSRRYNFKKLKKGKTWSTNSRYDLSSIVQLDGMALSSNNKPTMTEKATGQAVKADPKDFSPEDSRELEYVYCNTEQESGSSFVETPYSPPSSGYSPPSSSYVPPSWSPFPSSPPSGYPSPGVSLTPSAYPSPPASFLPSTPSSAGNEDCGNDGWGSWGPYGPCSVTCGQGYKKANRKCATSLSACSGSAVLETICKKPACASSSSSQGWYSPGQSYGTISTGSSSTSPYSPYPSPSYSPSSTSFRPSSSYNLWSSRPYGASSTSSSRPYGTSSSSTSSYSPWKPSSYGSSSSSLWPSSYGASSSTPSSSSGSSSWGTPSTSSTSSSYGGSPFAIARPQSTPSPPSNPWSSPSTSSSSSPSYSSFNPYQPPPSPWGASSSYGSSAGKMSAPTTLSLSGRSEGNWSPDVPCSGSCKGGPKVRTRRCQPGRQCFGRSKLYSTCSDGPC